jgi:hypothetical protein
MKRKLIQLSPTTLVVSIPKKWLTSQKLKKGSDVDITEQQNSIIIRANEQQQTTIAKIKVSGTRNKIDWFKVHAAYIFGYTAIELEFPSKSACAYADRFAQHFPGIITEYISERRVMLRDIGADIVDVEKIIQKVFYVLLAMTQDEVTVDVRKKKDYIINDYTALGLRQIRIQSKDVMVWSGLLYNLEQLGDLICVSAFVDEKLIRELQLLFLAYDDLQLEKVVKLCDKKPHDLVVQQINACIQSIIQVRMQIV